MCAALLYQGHRSTEKQQFTPHCVLQSREVRPWLKKVMSSLNFAWCDILINLFYQTKIFTSGFSDTRDLSACSNYSFVPEGQLVLQKKKHIWMRQETENRRKRRKRKWSWIQWSGRPNQQKPTTAVTSTLGQMIEIMGPDERHQEEDWGIEFSMTRYEDYIQILMKALLHVFIIGR